MSPRPAVVVFDVNQTLTDMQPLAGRFADVGVPAHLAQLWFAMVLRDGFGLAAAGTQQPFAEVATGVLRPLLHGRDLTMDLDAAVTHVMAGVQSPTPQSDAVEGIRALADAGLRLVTLSNGSADVADTLLTEAGVRDRFEQLLSVADAGIWKPGQAAYRYAAERCGTEPAEMLLVAVHPWDVDGAARAGLATAWVNRDGGPYPDHLTPPDYTVTALPDLAGLLG